MESANTSSYNTVSYPSKAVLAVVPTEGLRSMRHDTQTGALSSFENAESL